MIIFSCFAGRRKYMEILMKNIPSSVDEIHLWDYTRDEEDSVWLHENYKDYIFKVNDKSTYAEYYEYYNKERYPEDDTVLIKCDDDIVYIDNDEFDSFVEERRKCKSTILMTACVVNNPVCTHFMYANGIVKPEKNDSGDIFLFSPEHAKYIHESFLNGEFSKNDEDRFYLIDLGNHKLNINFIAFLSKDFDVISSNKIGKVNDEDELACLQHRALLDSHFFVAHMAFTKQREDGFEEDEILKRYYTIKEQKTYVTK